MTHKLIKTTDYILVVDDSLTIGKGYAVNRDYKIMKYNTDEHLAYDSYAVKKIIAHLPLNDSPILEGVDLLPPYSLHQEDGVDEYAKSCNKLYKEWLVTGYKSGYNKAREKYKYTEEDIRKAIDMATTSKHDSTLIFFNAEEIIQYLHQYPTEFECEMEVVDTDWSVGDVTTSTFPKTVTTAQGVQWVGKYK